MAGHGHANAPARLRMGVSWLDTALETTAAVGGAIAAGFAVYGAVARFRHRPHISALLEQERPFETSDGGRSIACHLTIRNGGKRVVAARLSLSTSPGLRILTLAIPIEGQAYVLHTDKRSLSSRLSGIDVLLHPEDPVQTTFPTYTQGGPGHVYVDLGLPDGVHKSWAFEVS